MTHNADLLDDRIISALESDREGFALPAGFAQRVVASAMPSRRERARFETVALMTACLVAIVACAGAAAIATSALRGIARAMSGAVPIAARVAVSGLLAFSAIGALIDRRLLRLPSTSTLT